MKKNIYGLVIAFLLTSCSTDFLEMRRDKQQVIPQELRDFQAVLDRREILNARSIAGMGEIGTDDFYMTDQNWNTISQPWIKNAYIWSEDIFEQEQSALWNYSFEKILLANLVIEGIDGFPESKEKRNILGQALFWRAYTYYQLAQLFCKDFQIEEKTTGVGLPLRISPNLEQHVEQSTLDETYEFIAKDLLTAVDLIDPIVPEIFGELKSRPSKSAVWALLARLYLQIGDYDQAYNFSDKVLGTGVQTLDYNLIDAEGATYPFYLYGKENPEVLLYETMYYHAVFGIARLIVSEELYDLYGDDDLRKELYFMVNGENLTYRGSYMGFNNFHPFPTVSEVKLIKAESAIRGEMETTEIVQALAAFGQNRHRNGDFDVEEIASERKQLLDYVLEERRRELAFRGVRWSDLRRLNRDESTSKELVRHLEGVEYRLEPMSNRYVMPIPYDEVLLNGYKQHDRK